MVNTNLGTYSMAMIPVRALMTPSVPRALNEQFRRAMGNIDWYDWDYLPEGTVLYEDTEDAVTLTRDYARIYAFVV